MNDRFEWSFRPATTPTNSFETHRCRPIGPLNCFTDQVFICTVWHRCWCSLGDAPQKNTYDHSNILSVDLVSAMSLKPPCRGGQRGPENSTAGPGEPLKISRGQNRPQKWPGNDQFARFVPLCGCGGHGDAAHRHLGKSS